jgi:hypothetical protein
MDSFADFALAPTLMDKLAIPQDDRKAVLCPTDHWALLGSQTALYMQDVAKGAYRNGDLGMIAGITTAMDQNIRTHTNGAAAGGGLVKGANQNVTYAASKDTNTQTLITDDWTSATTFKAGDVFTIADVYAVNPVSKQSTGVLQQFVIQNDITATGTDCTLTSATATEWGFSGTATTPGGSAAGQQLIVHYTADARL